MCVNFFVCARCGRSKAVRYETYARCVVIRLRNGKWCAKTRAECHVFDESRRVSRPRAGSCDGRCAGARKSISRAEKCPTGTGTGLTREAGRRACARLLVDPAAIRAVVAARHSARLANGQAPSELRKTFPAYSRTEQTESPPSYSRTILRR